MYIESSTPIDRWGIIKNWTNDNQADIVLVIGIILVTLISFGLGRMTVTKVNKEPVVIENQGLETRNLELGSGSVLNNLEQGLNQNNTGQGNANQNNLSTAFGNSSSSQQIMSAKGLVVGSKNSNKYHWPWCAAAKKIKPENQIWFKSEAEAQKAGYTACGSFMKLAPAGYKP